MIILPVEKRLKWSRAPYVLFGIVLVNIAIFFFYQMNDTGKHVEAFELYEKHELQKVEVPVYLDYLTLPENKEQRKIVEQQYLESLSNGVDEEDQLIPPIGQAYESMDLDPEDALMQMRNNHYARIVVPILLQDSGFYDYIKAQPNKFDTVKAYDTWKTNREEVNELLDSSSVSQFALIPAEKNWFTFLSHQFMHGDFMHLAGNMFFLIVCGFAVEAAIGHFRFLLFYLISGVIGGAVHVFSESNSIIPLVGASGAISGVMAMYMGIFRLRKIEFFYWFYIFVGYFRAPALVILAIYMTTELVSYFYFDDGVAYLAHIGGFIAGIVLIATVLVVKRDFLDEEYIEADDSIEPAQARQAEIMNALEKLHFKKALDLVSEAVQSGTTQDKYYRTNVLLNAKLLFLVNDPEAENSVVRLLANNKPQSDKLADYLKLWTKVKHKTQTAQEDRIKLGLMFSELDDVNVSERIFMSLAKQKFRDDRMSVLAGRLAYYYDQNKQPDKADYFLKLSNVFKCS